MSLATVCQAAAQAAGFASPSSIVGNSDGTAVLLLALANKAIKTLARMPWQALQKEHTFSTVASTETYALPSDYGWYQNDTAWDRSNYWNMRGSLSPAAWQWYKSGIMSTTPRSRFRVRGNLVYIDPIPSSVRSIVIEYVSNKPVTDGVSFFTGFTADTQTSLIDEYLLELEVTWRFLERKGFAYEEAKNESDTQVMLGLGHDTPSMSVNLGSGGNGPWPPLPTLPTTGYS